MGTFLHERKHRFVKRYADARHNTKNFDKGLMEEVTCQALYDIRSEFLRPELIHPRQASKKMRDVIWDMFPRFWGQEV
eukprot:6192066-Pyramimonas_sp.AAC.1